MASYSNDGRTIPDFGPWSQRSPLMEVLGPLPAAPVPPGARPGPDATYTAEKVFVVMSAAHNNYGDVLANVTTITHL